MPKDFHDLPMVKDSLTFLYVERAVIEQDNLSIVSIQKDARTPIPIAAMTVLMLGPGVSITHAAIKAIADNGCTVIWCGEHGAKYYAMGMGETHSSVNLMRQARLHADPDLHMRVVSRMYSRRFGDMDVEGMSLRQIRGLEGVRMREAYKHASKTYNVPWKKRDYKQDSWEDADEINRALSMANAILYALCQACIASLGFSTGLGFVHTGKMLSFVYDIADLYKAETTIPAAFSVVGGSHAELDRQIRIACRRFFRERQILKRIPEDLKFIFDVEGEIDGKEAKMTGDLWDEEDGALAGGVNYGREV